MLVLGKKRHLVFLLAVAVMVVLALGLAPSAMAFPKSSSVVFIGGTTISTDGYTNYDTAANYFSRSGGGWLPVSGPVGIGPAGVIGNLNEFSFSPMAPADVNAASLAAYDTVVLNMASYAMWQYDPTGGTEMFTLSAAQKQAIVDWVAAGGKLIIYDSEMSQQGSGLDYSWLPYAFTTSNPGAMGASGTLTIVEDNVLSSADPMSPYFIDAIYLGSGIDAVGDMNVMTTYNPNWYVDMAGTNALGTSGPVHTYARYGNGLMIYNGMDQDYQYDGAGYNGLAKTWYLELACAFNPTPPEDLPSGQNALGITLTPATATNPVGTMHKVTAKMTDVLGNPLSNISVTIAVESGPNLGMSATGMTDAAGEFWVSYLGLTPGIDKLVASYIPAAGTEVVYSNYAYKEWTSGSGDTEPPVITIQSPTDLGLYAAGSVNTFSFSATDNIGVTSLQGVLDNGTVVSSGDPLPSVPGVYVLTVTASDAAGNTAQKSVTFVVYDPTAGFVTGGGWIDSLAGAYAADPLLAGKAHFAFVSRYKKGATVPDGSAEFNFTVGDLHFKSTAQQWLVVNKAGGVAQFKCSGMVNGALAPSGVPYDCMIWAGDGVGTSSADTFRIKIWYKDANGAEVVVYDNGAKQAIGGGAITIHAK